MGFLETLKRHDITSVWHFTDEANLKSIERHGILSLRNIIDNNIEVSHFGADDLSHSLDKYYGLDRYVHLSFIADHPMYYIARKRGSIIRGVWIELDIDILLMNDVLFSDKVANQTGVKPFSYKKVEEKIDFRKMFHNDFRTRVEARKAEIMVLSHIRTDNILGVYYG